MKHKLIVGILAILAGATASCPAFALDTGKCAPAGQVRAELAAQNMQPIIVGNRTGYGYPTSLIFFANADGRGVLVRGDKPLGQQAEIACIDSVYRDVHLNDVSVPGIPAWAKMTSDPKAVESLCRQNLGYQNKCQPHDQALSNLEGNGHRVMLMAIGTAINPRDQAVRTNQRLFVVLDPIDRTGLVMATTTEGASYMLSAYSSAAFSQHGTAMLAIRK